jgi:hypothetical protein
MAHENLIKAAVADKNIYNEANQYPDCNHAQDSNHCNFCPKYNTRRLAAKQFGHKPEHVEELREFMGTPFEHPNKNWCEHFSMIQKNQIGAHRHAGCPGCI